MSSQNVQAPVDLLNYDCLIMIFDYFPLERKLELPQVSSRWKAIIDDFLFQKSTLALSRTERYVQELLPLTPNIETLKASFINCTPSVLFKSLAGSCPVLKHLELSFFHASQGDTMNDLGPICQQLSTLYLTDCTLLTGSEFPTFLLKCCNMKKLVLKRVRMVTTFHSWVQNIASPLEELQIIGTRFRLEDLIQISNKIGESLREVKFSLDKTNIDQSSLKKLCKVTDCEMKAFENIPRDAVITLRGNWNNFFDFDNFKGLSIKCAQSEISEIFIRETVTSFPGLQNLKLRDLEKRLQWPPHTLLPIQGLKNLKFLDISNNYMVVTDEMLMQIAQNLPNLQHLNVEQNDKLTDLLRSSCAAKAYYILTLRNAKI